MIPSLKTPIQTDDDLQRRMDRVRRGMRRPDPNIPKRPGLLTRAWRRLRSFLWPT